MKSYHFRALAALIVILITGHCLAQDLDLSFDGACAGEIPGAAGSVQTTSLD